MSMKISSVLQLARYQVGHQAWCLALRPKAEITELAEADAWMLQTHPSVLYKIGPYRKLWSERVILPRLRQLDFTHTLKILGSTFAIEIFTICDLKRSNDTGEFYYSNDANEWVPDTTLFATKAAARREKHRLLTQFRKWLDHEQACI